MLIALPCNIIVSAVGCRAHRKVSDEYWSKSRHRFAVLHLLLLFTSPQSIFADPIQLLGDIVSPTNISAAVMLEDRLVIASDETNGIQIMTFVGNGKYQAGDLLPLMEGDDEIDLEGLTYDGEYFYAVGSHALVRKKLKPDEDTQKKSRKRITDLEMEAARDNIFRFQLTNDGSVQSAPERMSLRTIFDEDKLLRPFANIASKENGVDIEGIAAHDGKLYLGFRGPVLREGYVPILIVSFAQPDEYKLNFVNLDGSGVRDITRTSNSFLILAGPVNEFGGEYTVFEWNGVDCLPGKDIEPNKARMLMKVPAPPDGKAEAIVVLEEDNERYKLLILFDGTQNGGPLVMDVSK